MLRDLIKTLLKEDQQIIDSLLDKINKSGINSLTTAERNILDKVSSEKFKGLDREFELFLNKKLGHLEIFNTDYKKFGKFDVTEYSYVNNQMEPIFKLQIANEGKLLVDSELWRELKLEFNLNDEKLTDLLIAYLNYNYPYIDGRKVNYSKVKIKLMFWNID